MDAALLVIVRGSGSSNDIDAQRAQAVAGYLEIRSV